MNKDSHLIFENYVDGITRRKNELAGNIMDIVRYGIPTKEEFIKIRQELHDLVDMVKKRGDKATEEENSLARELIGKIRSYRSQHPDDPPVVRNLHNPEESAEETCIEDLAEKHGVSLEDITNQLEMGLKVEMEHTKDIAIAKKIAMDHLTEDPHYYTKLSKIENGENAEEEGELMKHMKQQGMISKDAKVTMPKHETEEEENSPFHYDPMSGLAKAANQIKDILHGAANDEARTEHIIKMAQIILGDPKEHTPAEYRKMLDGLIVLLNRFIVVPMNEYEEMPTKQFINLKQFINKGPIKIKKPSKELHSTHSKIHDLAKQDSREGQKEENAEDSNTNKIVSYFRKTFGPGEKERMIKNNIDPYEFFVDYYSWMKHYDPKILSNFAEIYNSQYPDHKVDTKKLLSMFQAIKDVPLKGYQAPGKKSENEERRLDPKCWKGYHKQGTKLKDGKRVNNCVKNS